MRLILEAELRELLATHARLIPPGMLPTVASIVAAALAHESMSIVQTTDSERAVLEACIGAEHIIRVTVVAVD
jgi:hypothetical protein